MPLEADRILIVHAFTHLRLVVDREVADILDWFAQPREMPFEMPALIARSGVDRDILAACLANLMERGVLTDRTPEMEAEETAAKLNELHGRDPGEALDRLRRGAKEGADPYWSVSEALGADVLGRRFDRRWDILLFGDCELQMEADFLRRAAAMQNVDLHVATGFPGDVRLAQERPHLAVVVGALRSRRVVATAHKDDDPPAHYIAEARSIIAGLRAVTTAPILLDNLPEPTVQPLGFAERGPLGHRNRFRQVNLGLSALAEEWPDVHIVDIAAALSGHGSRALMDDGLVGFTHFGSPGWMAQRPASEKAAVHGLFPDVEPLLDAVGGDPYRRETVAAKAHMDSLSVVMALDRKKVVVLDIDGTLWPGVLAETGAPFAWAPEVSGLYSYVGLYFGLHEALQALKRRGVLLACVSKNDEDLVRRLWTYPEHYPKDRLLTLDDFVTVRINWRDKSDNIASIADELGFPLSAFAFIDDHPVERERVRQALPSVWTFGEDPFALRRLLLEDPRFQSQVVTEEASARTTLVRAQLQRDRERKEANDPGAFLRSLDVVCAFDRPRSGPTLERAAELIQRTTQFNATGLKLSLGEVARHAAAGDLFVASARDRLGDYGLVAAAVVEKGEIIAVVMSCRVIGLGVDQRFIAHLLGALEGEVAAVRGRIIETDRNGPVRHLYRDAGFSFDGVFWRRTLGPQAPWTHTLDA